MTNGYVIWFLDNHYTYSWGLDEQDALNKYLTNHAAGIKAVVPSDNYHDALPPSGYLPPQRNAVWDEHEPEPGQLLYPITRSLPDNPENLKLAERVKSLEALLAVERRLNATLKGAK